MNSDDPFGELINGQQHGDRKPAAKKPTNQSTGFCEYCGAGDHLTKRSKKCTAALDSAKKFRKENGTLLLEAQTVPLTVPPTAMLLALQDCDQMDSLPFDAEYNSDDDDQQLAGDWAAADDDNESVAVVGGTI